VIQYQGNDKYLIKIGKIDDIFSIQDLQDLVYELISGDVITDYIEFIDDYEDCDEDCEDYEDCDDYDEDCDDYDED
jgi:hypothetical protein